jgi:predicted lipoprotein with Yx(FWY)xxD motif
MSMNRVTRCALGAAGAAASMVLLSACASSHTASAGSSGSAASGSGSTTGLLTESTSIGTVAADASGHTLYELVGDTTAKPTCTGSCLSIWPAAMASGTQVVLQGHPAFTYTKDTASGQVGGQGVTDQWGTWYALDSSGNPITKAAATGSASTSSSKGSGGYGY